MLLLLFFLFLFLYLSFFLSGPTSLEGKQDETSLQWSVVNWGNNPGSLRLLLVFHRAPLFFFVVSTVLLSRLCLVQKETLQGPTGLNDVGYSYLNLVPETHDQAERHVESQEKITTEAFLGVWLIIVASAN